MQDRMSIQCSAPVIIKTNNSAIRTNQRQLRIPSITRFAGTEFISLASAEIDQDVLINSNAGIPG